MRVNDLRLDDVDGMLHLVAVDVGAAGLLRRLGVEGAFRVVARNVGLSTPERYIDWEDVDPVETSIASIKLRVPHAGLAELHPADLATIIDQLAPRDRAGVLASLDDEAAADAIEEMEPDTQVEVLEDLAPERAADILEEMSPDDAADLVQDLSDETRAELLALMERDEADELGELLRYPEDTAGGTMTTEFVAVPADLSAAATIDRLRELEPDAETIYYVYVSTPTERLVGVLSLRDLIVAPPASPVGEVDDPRAGRRGRARGPRRGGRRGANRNNPPGLSEIVARGRCLREWRRPCSACRDLTHDRKRRFLGVIGHLHCQDTTRRKRGEQAPQHRRMVGDPLKHRIAK